jgi:hypothetical protein
MYIFKTTEIHIFKHKGFGFLLKNCLHVALVILNQVIIHLIIRIYVFVNYLIVA